MEEDITIELDENVEEIVRRNLDEKVEEYIETITNCDKCQYYKKFWFWGSNLHCCAYPSNQQSKKQKDPITSRDIDNIYKQCPINHQVNRKRTYIKRYGIRHHKASRYYSGSLDIIDFDGTTFESDGYNPDIEEKIIASFYYKTQKEYNQAKEMALYYYNKFNLDAEYIKKECWG